MVEWLTAATTRLEGPTLVERQQIAAVLGEWERTAAWAAEARAWFWRIYDQFPQFDAGLAEGIYQLK